LIERIHRELDVPVMADIATLEEALVAAGAGADMVGTTLNGYTEPTRNNHHFSWPLLADMVNLIDVPVVAEGHISSPDEAQRALAAGAWCVIVGSAITRPGAITASFVRALQGRPTAAPAIGVDIGGTCIKAGQVNPSGEVSLLAQAPTNASGGRDAILASLCNLINQVISASHKQGHKPTGLGIASAGAINPRDGSVFAATDNLPGWAGFELQKFAEERFNLPTWVVNDAHAAVLAELKPPSRPLERLAVKTSGKVIFVKLEDVDYIESAHNYVEVHVDKQSHLLRETLNSIEARLPAEKFVRISRSVIVHIERVKELQPLFYGEYAVTLHNGTRLTLSRRYRDRLERLGLT